MYIQSYTLVCTLTWYRSASANVLQYHRSKAAKFSPPASQSRYVRDVKRIKERRYKTTIQGENEPIIYGWTERRNSHWIFFQRFSPISQINIPSALFPSCSWLIQSPQTLFLSLLSRVGKIPRSPREKRLDFSHAAWIELTRTHARTHTCSAASQNTVEYANGSLIHWHPTLGLVKYF